jgi:hypothetical protein
VGIRERRERYAQREAVDRVLPDADKGALLRASSGDVLVYDERGGKLNPINLRAVVMPDGTTRQFGAPRFRRTLAN